MSLTTFRIKKKIIRKPRYHVQVAEEYWGATYTAWHCLGLKEQKEFRQRVLAYMLENIEKGKKHIISSEHIKIFRIK